MLCCLHNFMLHWTLFYRPNCSLLLLMQIKLCTFSAIELGTTCRSCINSLQLHPACRLDFRSLWWNDRQRKYKHRRVSLCLFYISFFRWVVCVELDVTNNSPKKTKKHKNGLDRKLNEPNNWNAFLLAILNCSRMRNVYIWLYAIYCALEVWS